MGKNLEHIVHSALIAAVAYLVMVFLLKQSKNVACNHSVLLFALVLVYMCLFGHSFPPRLSNLF